MNREYVYPAFGRFWHWAQSFLILFLALTGFEIHGSIRFFGYEQAVRFHNFAAWSFLVLIAFAVFWHFTTDEWRQYVPTWENLRAQAEYYLFGIFQDAPHPTRKTRQRKLNPLQKIVYAGLKLVILPLIWISGLLYMFYRYPQKYDVLALDVSALQPIALAHTVGAFAVLCFLVAHVYLTTTGHTLTSNLKAMVTGWEEMHDGPHAAAGAPAAPDAAVEAASDAASPAC